MKNNEVLLHGLVMEAFQKLIRTENIINEQIKGIVVYIRTAGNEFWGVEDVPISFFSLSTLFFNSPIYFDASTMIEVLFICQNHQLQKRKYQNK
jgi:hypothetical protein